MTTREAASLLGVSVQRANRLIEAGHLDRVAHGLVYRASVERYIAAGHGGRKRVWAEHTAWGAIALLSGESADWLGDVQILRLRAALREMSGAAEMVTRCRDRAIVRTYSGHRAAAARLREDLVSTDTAALGLVTLSDDTRTDGYVTEGRLDDIVRRNALREDSAGGFVLRATGFDIDIVRRLATGSLLAALDAATSLDPRERGVGERTLAAALERFQ